MDTAQREQCVVAGDTQPQKREAQGDGSQYSGCTLSDRVANPGIEHCTAEEQEHAGSDGDDQKVDGEGYQDGFPDGCRMRDCIASRKIGKKKMQTRGRKAIDGLGHLHTQRVRSDCCRPRETPRSSRSAWVKTTLETASSQLNAPNWKRAVVA